MPRTDRRPELQAALAELREAWADFRYAFKGSGPRREYQARILGPADRRVDRAIDEYVAFRRLPIDDRLDNHFAELARAPWYSRLWEWIQG
jgi:hypothetical protein